MRRRTYFALARPVSGTGSRRSWRRAAARHRRGHLRYRGGGAAGSRAARPAAATGVRRRATPGGSGVPAAPAVRAPTEAAGSGGTRAKQRSTTAERPPTAASDRSEPREPPINRQVSSTTLRQPLAAIPAVHRHPDRATAPKTGTSSIFERHGSLRGPVNSSLETRPLGLPGPHAREPGARGVRIADPRRNTPGHESAGATTPIAP